MISQQGARGTSGGAATQVQAPPQLSTRKRVKGFSIGPPRDRKKKIKKRERLVSRQPWSINHGGGDHRGGGGRIVINSVDGTLKAKDTTSMENDAALKEKGTTVKKSTEEETEGGQDAEGGRPSCQMGKLNVVRSGQVARKGVGMEAEEEEEEQEGGEVVSVEQQGMAVLAARTTEHAPCRECDRQVN